MAMYSKLLPSLLIAGLLLAPACSKEENALSPPQGADPPAATVPEQANSPGRSAWKTYLAEQPDDRDLLDIKIPNEYSIIIEFDPETKSYTGRQTVIYTNNEDVPLGEVYFHIYPNAFRSESTTPYSPSSYVQGFTPGSIDITKVSAAGKVVQHSILGVDNTLLNVPMHQSLLPGEAVEIYMEYVVTLPHTIEKFGYGGKTFQVGNGCPTAAIYDSRGWNLDPYHAMGDPFYSDVSNYNVTIKAPTAFTIACSGKVLSETAQGSNTVWLIEANQVRDFAWAASQHFIVQERVVDGVLVKNYLLPNVEAVNTEAADLAYKAVEVYNRIFGPYPYEVLSVVTADATGMEYPGMVFVWKNTWVGNKSLESTIIHEIAHQWWYGAVGNNQIREAWLDESFAIYAQKLFYDEVYGETLGEKYYQEKIVGNYNQRRSGAGEERILTPAHENADWNQYTALLHKGAMFLHAIETACGKNQFYSILNTYYERYKFSIATTRDFIGVCQELSGMDLEEEINTWFFGQ